MLNHLTSEVYKNLQDSTGKLHEALVGHALNNDKPLSLESYNKFARTLFGVNFEQNPNYKNTLETAEKASSNIKAYLSENFGINKINRVIFSSKINNKDLNSTADVIITGDNGIQADLSLKVGKTKTPNYKNPGIETYENWSGANLKHLNKDHIELLEKYNKPTHELYKIYRDTGNVIAAIIKDSSNRLNKKVAAEIHKALFTKTHEELYGVIKLSISPPTRLPTILSHVITKSDNSLDIHKIRNLDNHVNNYLDMFDNLHLKIYNNTASVTIYGTHKNSGKLMSVWRTSVYAGGKPSNKLPRGSTKLPSENRVLS